MQADLFLFERKLIDAFSHQKLGFDFRIYRGLPRLYQVSDPTKWKIKKHFSDLSALKRAVAEKAMLRLYDGCELERDSKISLFTWVIGDGFGDYIAAVEAARLLRDRFPHLEVQMTVLIPEGLSNRLFSLPKNCLLLPYETDLPPARIPHQTLAEMRTSDLIVFFPTFYPHTPTLIDLLKKMSDVLPMPKIERIGEYGFIESSWFHPQSGNRSTGLHFLETGILVRKVCPASFAEVKNERLLQWLFQTNCPTLNQIGQYVSENRFYLAYLTSETGGAVYLHALLKSLECDPKGVDLCVPDLGWFVKHAETQNRLGAPVLEGDFSVARLEVWFEDKVHAIDLRTQGKKVRIFCPGSLSQDDFRKLLFLSGEFVAVRGDQSFSEAVSANKAFFYDGREHARYFVKDLIAFAENQISSYRGTLAVFRGIGKTFLHHLPDSEGEWVEETHFQEKGDWVQIALEIGEALQDSGTITGFKQFNRALVQEFSFNESLCHLVQKALHFKKYPEAQQLEQEQLTLFSSHLQSFEKTYAVLQDSFSSVL
jgi:hypothetical protein